MRSRIAPVLRRLSGLDPLVVDGGVALGMAVGSWVWTVWEPQQAWRPADFTALVLTAVVNLPLALRRRAPSTVLAVSTAAATVFHVLGYHSVTNNMGPLLALYSVAVRRPWHHTAAGAVLVTMEWTHAIAQAPGVPQAMLSALGQSLMVVGVVVAIGTSARLLAQRTEQLATRTAELAVLADRLHRQQAAVAERAVMHERLQIARELHDVVANYMSIIAVQAGLGRYVARSDPPTSQQALDVIADTSHQALTEMRRLLSILRVETRDEEDLYAVPPGVRRLHWLVERMNRAGLTIEFTVHGTVRDLPPGLDLCVYRIVQESLTNTLKHAGRARAEVSLTYAPAELTVRVRDDGVRVGTEGVHVSTEGVPASLPPTDSGGHGLIGMAERVRLYEGSITTGPRPQGGYEVIAVFPLAGLPRLGQQADAGPSGAA